METEPSSADALTRTLASYGLPRQQQLERLCPSEQEWPGLLGRLLGERLTGIAVAGVEAGWLRLRDHEVEELLRHHREAMLMDLALERKLLELTASLKAAGVEVVILKGSALAHGFYPDPSWRCFGDLDVLVRTSAWRQACRLLEEMGFRRNLPEAGKDFDVRFGKAACHTDASGVQVDLHRMLVLGPFGFWLDPDELFERTLPFPLGGRVLRRLDDTATLLHACLHASLGSWPPLLLPLRDLAQVAWHGRVDWDLLADLVGRWKLRSVVGHALRTSVRTLGVRQPDEAAALMVVRPTPRERRVLEAYTTERRRRGGTALEAVRGIPGVRAKAFYLRTMLVPDREFLEARAGDGGHPSYLRRWMVPVRWLTGRWR